MTFLFLLFFVLFPIFVFYISKKLGFDLFVIGMPQFVITALFFFSYLGTLPLFMQWDAYRVSNGITDPWQVFKVMLFSSYTIVMVLFGSSFAKMFLPAPFQNKTINEIQMVRLEFYFLMAAILLVLVVIFDYSNKIPDFAIRVLFQDGIDAANVARSKMGNDFAGKYHWYYLVMHHFINIITFSLFVFYLKRKRKHYFLAFILSFFISTFTAVMAIEKGPFAWLIIGLFLTYVLVKNKGIYPIKKLFFLFLAVMLFLMTSYIYAMGTVNFSDAIMGVFSRAFAGSIEPAYHYFNFFPEQQDFLYGRTFPNPSGIFPFESFRYTVEVMNWVHPDILTTGVVGSAPAVFWTEAYANFGVLGVFFIPFFIGFLLQLVDCVFSFIVRTPLTTGLYVWLLLHYKDLSMTGFSGYLIDFYVIFVFAFFFVIWLLAHGFKLPISRLALRQRV